jgi:hypothetical protein
MYKEKIVQLVAEIEAVVDVDPENGSSVVKWKNVSGEDQDFQDRAAQSVSTRGNTDGPARVFLLGPLFETNFRKDSLYGMQSSKRYFNVSELEPKDAEHLAQLLRDQKWSEFGDPPITS